MADQARRSIREELLTIPGVAGADFDGDAVQPAGVKVQLAPGADPDDVGRRVRRVLAGHGMRSQLTAPSVAPRTPPPPPEPRTVINLSDFDPSLAHPDEAADGDQFPVLGTVADESAPQDDPTSPDTERPDTAVAAAMPADEVHPPGQQSEPSRSVSVLEDVTITQDESGVIVAVSAGGQTAQRRAVDTAEGIDVAVLSAVCQLMGVSPEPALVEVVSSVRDGSAVLSVLIDDGNTRRAESAVDRGNRSWTVARAIWSAVSAPA